MQVLFTLKIQYGIRWHSKSSLRVFLASLTNDLLWIHGRTSLQAFLQALNHGWRCWNWDWSKSCSCLLFFHNSTYQFFGCGSVHQSVLSSPFRWHKFGFSFETTDWVQLCFLESSDGHRAYCEEENVLCSI